MIIYWQLIYEYFKTGLFAFGGGYSTLPFLYNISENYGWYSANQLSNMLAISSITPGPVGVNVATYSGYTTAGILGALIATGAVVLPSFIIVILITKLLNKFKENKYVQTAIYGLKPAGCGLLCAVAIKLFLNNITQVWAYILFGILLILSLKIKKDPIIYLGLSALAGFIIGICR